MRGSVAVLVKFYQGFLAMAGKGGHPMSGKELVVMLHVTVQPLIGKLYGSPEAIVRIGEMTIGTIFCERNTIGGPMWYTRSRGIDVAVGRTPQEAAMEMLKEYGYILKGDLYNKES